MLQKIFPSATALLTATWVLASGCTHEVPSDGIGGYGGAAASGVSAATGAVGSNASGVGGTTMSGCAAGFVDCGAGCVDTMSSGAHCGACGNACPAGQVCSSGVCAASCGAGQTQCGSGCVVLQSDPNNCGSCGAVCSGSCVGGACAADAMNVTDASNTTTTAATTTTNTTGLATSTNGGINAGNTAGNNAGNSASNTTSMMSTSTDGGTTTGGMLEPEENISGGSGQCPGSWGGSNDGSITWYTFSQGTAAAGDVNCSFGIQQNPDRVNHVFTGNGEYFAAMNSADYNQAAACGACVEVTRGDTGQKVTVTIVDQCPTSSNDKCVQGHLDLSQAAFSQLGNVGDGYLGSRAGNGQISWVYVPCPTQENVSFKLKEPDNEFWNEILVQSHKAPIQSVEVRVNGNWVNATRQEYNYWAPPGNDFGTPPYRVRATDINGNFIEASIDLAPGDLDTGLQLCQ